MADDNKTKNAATKAAADKDAVTKAAATKAAADKDAAVKAAVANDAAAEKTEEKTPAAKITLGADGAKATTDGIDFLADDNHKALRDNYGFKSVEGEAYWEGKIEDCKVKITKDSITIESPTKEALEKLVELAAELHATDVTLSGSKEQIAIMKRVCKEKHIHVVKENVTENKKEKDSKNEHTKKDRSYFDKKAMGDIPTPKTTK